MFTVLIADDDEYINSMLAEALQRDGYNVLRAFSGTEALMLAEQKRPDIILLDLMLPGMNGEEVLKKINGIPVIVVSAKTAPDGKAELLYGGAADYVTKPFDIRELEARIKLRLRCARDGYDKAVLTAGGLALGRTTHTCTVNGNEIKLTRTEFAILTVLKQTGLEPITPDK